MDYAANSISNKRKQTMQMSQLSSKPRLIAAFLLGLSMLQAANAQDHKGQPEEWSATSNSQGASNLTLAATTIRTETGILNFGFNSVAGFVPTTFVCPRSGLHDPGRGLC